MTAKALAGGKDLIKHFFGGDYAYDSLAITLKHKLAANQHVSIGYQMINFNNHNGGSFDDYTANGALLTYTCTF